MAILTVKKTKERLNNEGIKLPEDFCERAESERSFYGQRLLSNKDISEAIKLADFWKNFLISESDYDGLIAHILYRLYKIHCVALTTSPECSYYIGNIVEVKRNAYVFNDVVTTAMTCGEEAHFVSSPGRYSFN